LREYTREEAVPWTELVLERAALLIDIGEGCATDTTLRALEALLARCKSIQAMAFVPRIEAALQGSLSLST
jgi:hypothetical protein